MDPDSKTNYLVPIFLLLGLNLYYLFFWGFTFGFILIFGTGNLGLLLGYISRTGVVIIFYLIWTRRYSTTKITSNKELVGDVADQDSNNGTKNVISYKDLVVIGLIMYCLPYFVVQFMRMLGVVFESQPSSSMDHDFVVDYFFVVIIGPILEEIIFRWMFFHITDYFDSTVFKLGFNVKLGLNVSIFALIHYGQLGFGIFAYSVYVPWIFTWLLLGFVFFILYHKTRDLKKTIIMHMIFNFIVMTIRLVNHFAIDWHFSIQITTPRVILFTILLFLILYYTKYNLIFQRMKGILSSINWIVLLVTIPLTNILYWVLSFVPFYYVYNKSIIYLSIFFILYFPLYTYLFPSTFHSKTI